MPTIPFPEIIRSMRKTMSLHISPKGELIVKAPFFVPEKLIQQFIRNKEAWIAQAVQKITSSKISEKSYQEGAEFLYLGDVYKLRIGNFKEISVHSSLNFPDFLVFRIKKELMAWYINQAKKVITTQVEYFSKQMNTKYKSIRFSDTSSKWGSCGPDNALQFNWRLIMAPLMVINYVVIHELAHTIEKNHGPRFWSKVRLYTPAHKQHSKWLERNRQLLSGFG